MSKKRIKTLSLLVFFSSILFVFTSNISADDKPYLCFEGVMYDDNRALAIVNGEVLGLGDTIDGAKVLRINDTFIRFEYNDETFFKDLGEGCIKEDPTEEAKKPKIKAFIENIKSRSLENSKKCLLLGKKKIDPADAMKIMIIFWSIALVGYAYMSLALQIIARKTKTENAWLAWIPIANLYIMCKIADAPCWWLLLLFIPFINFIIAIVLWIKIAQARDKSALWGILIIVPIVNFIAIGYLAFSK